MKAALLFVSAAVFALAAPSVTAEEIHPRAERLAERLSLDDEQTREISDLMVAHREAMREQLESDEQPRGRELRDRLRESRAQLQEQIRGVLTDEQAESFDRLGSRAGRGMERRGRGNRADDGAAESEGRMAGANLDAEKREQLRALRERQREEVRSLRARHREEVQALMEGESGEQPAGENEGQPDEAGTRSAEEESGEG